MKTVDYTAFHPELFAKMTRQGAFLTTKGADGTIKLYAVMEARVPNEGLIVAVWDKYVDSYKVPVAAVDIKAAY